MVGNTRSPYLEEGMESWLVLLTLLNELLGRFKVVDKVRVEAEQVVCLFSNDRSLNNEGDDNWQ